MKPAENSRLDAVDVLRGLVMVLMTLDHVREFLHLDAPDFNPTDLDRTYPALFLTRWITHFCAPIFVFLAGTSAYFIRARSADLSSLASFMRRRGAWLILLELTVIRFGWMFNVNYELSVGQVVWAIGWAMIGLSLMLRWSPRRVAVLGIVIISTHNLLDRLSVDSFGSMHWVWSILHDGDAFNLLPGVTFVPKYPVLPWLGVIALGYGFGEALRQPRLIRRRVLFRTSALMVAAFLVLRSINLYGDPNPWYFEGAWLKTVFSFLNCEKYPPSLGYLLMTLGPSLALLALLDRPLGARAGRLAVFGRVPFFFYLLHIPLIHGVAAAFDGIPLPAPFGDGGGHLTLIGVYGVTGLVAVILYPACEWFAGVKQRRRDIRWLRYL